LAATGSRAEGFAGGLGARFANQEAIVFLVALLLVAIFSASLDGFATIGNILNLGRSVAVLGLLGLGMGIVVIGRGLDLSQVASMAISTAIVVQMVAEGYGLAPALMVGFCVAVLIGVINGLIIAFIEIPPLFTTLATNFLVYGVAREFVLKGFISYMPKEETGFLFLGQGTLLGVPMPIVVFAVVAVIVHWFMSQTRLGRFIYAHGDNADAARLSGVAIRPLAVGEYVLCALIAYVAGLVDAATTASVNTQVINSTLIFDVILVVVLGGISLVGGRGSVFSVIAGTLLIGVLLNGMTIMNLDGQIQNIIKGLVLLAAILLDNRLHPRDDETAKQGD
jgi:ribose transport system permease protein